MKTPFRLLILVAGALLLAAACGSDDDTTDGTVEGGTLEDSTVEDSTAEDGVEDSSADEGAVEEGTSAEDSDESSSSGGTATLTIADGTVYEFVLTTCDTSDTDPSALPLDNGYDIFGQTDDGAFEVQLVRAGFTNDDVVFAGALEGDFDDEGKNAKMLYSVNGDTVALTATGTEISGTMMLRAVGPPTRPHGDETEATLDAQC